jgi:serine/threonine protein phosphatase PrpC
MDDLPPDNIRQIQNKQKAVDAAKQANEEYDEKSKKDGDSVSYVVPDSLLEADVKPNTKSIDIKASEVAAAEQPASKEEAATVPEETATEKKAAAKVEPTEEHTSEEEPAAKEEAALEKEAAAEGESAEQAASEKEAVSEGGSPKQAVSEEDPLTKEDSPAVDRVSVAKEPVAELELRLPNVRQGVRSPGLVIKRSQKMAENKHRWEKCYLDPDANATGEELGIDYDIDSRLLHVTPSKHGNYIIWFTMEDPKYAKLKCILTVIPDPKTLWTASDPPEDAPYPKEHKDSKFLLAGKRIMAGASVRGRSHARDGTHRDDDFIVCEIVDGWNLMVVADGAGSAKFSRKGSQILVETMHSLISEKLGDKETLKKLNTEASEAIDDDSSIDRAENLLVLGAYSSLQKIQDEAKSQEAKTKDFNTTIISCLFKELGDKTFIYSFCIGDGALFVVEVDSKKIFSLNAADSGEFAGQTRFLTTPEVWQDHGVYERVKFATVEGPLSIIGMTDGVSDPLLPDVDEIEEYAQIGTLLNGLEGDDSVEGLLDVLRKTVEKNDAIDLEEWLNFYVAKHHDDRSIAVALDPQFLS